MQARTPAVSGIRENGGQHAHAAVWSVVAFRHGSARYDIRVENPRGVCRGVTHVELDGVAQADAQAPIPLVDDGVTHKVRVVLG